MYDTECIKHLTVVQEQLFQQLQGGKMYVYADGSFKYKTYQLVLMMVTAGTDSFYYAVQSDDTTNNRISDIKKVYIGFNIADTTPTGITFKEADGTTVISDDDEL